MQYRKFGTTDLTVSALGLGTSPLGGGFFKRDDQEALRVIAAALDQGVTFFDTSDNYSNGRAERLLGRALKGRRDRVVIASKGAAHYRLLGRVITPLQPVLRPFLRPLEPVLRRPRRPIALVRNHQKRLTYGPDDLRRAVEGSLRRLQTDYLDLYQLHSVPAAHLEADDAMEGLERLRQAGKIRYGGITVLTPEDALAGLRHAGALASIQVAINVFEREPLEHLVPEAERRGIAIIARSPLAQGILTDAEGHVMADESSHHTAEELAERKARRDELRRTLATDGCTLAQAALRFLLRADGVTTTIFSAITIPQLSENLGALIPDSPTADADRTPLRAAAG